MKKSSDFCRRIFLSDYSFLLVELCVDVFPSVFAVDRLAADEILICFGRACQVAKNVAVVFDCDSVFFEGVAQIHEAFMVEERNAGQFIFENFYAEFFKRLGIAVAFRESAARHLVGLLVF